MVLRESERLRSLLGGTGSGNIEEVAPLRPACDPLHFFSAGASFAEIRIEFVPPGNPTVLVRPPPQNEDADQDTDSRHDDYQSPHRESHAGKSDLDPHAWGSHGAEP